MGGREFIWPVMFYRWTEKPLTGWGFGSSFDVKEFGKTVNNYGLNDPFAISKKKSAAPHNVLLWALVELGIIGAILITRIYWLHLRHLFDIIRFKKGRSNLSLRLCLALVGIGIVVFLLSIGEDVFLRRFFWLYLALIEATWLIRKNEIIQERSIT